MIEIKLKKSGKLLIDAIGDLPFEADDFNPPLEEGKEIPLNEDHLSVISLRGGEYLIAKELPRWLAESRRCCNIHELALALKEYSEELESLEELEDEDVVIVFKKSR